MKRWIGLSLATCLALFGLAVARPGVGGNTNAGADRRTPVTNTNPGSDRVNPAPNNANPGADAATPGVTYVKWDALTTTQQEAVSKGWGMDPVKAAAKWNALQLADQNDALVKYAKFKVVAPRH